MEARLQFTSILKLIGRVLLVIGFFLGVYGVLSDPLMPPQDPPEEVQQAYLRELESANRLLRFGGVGVSFGIVLEIAGHVLKRRRIGSGASSTAGR